MTTTFSIRLFAISLCCGLLLAGSTGCDQAEGAAPQATATVKPVSSSSMAQDGQRLYNQSCAACHGFNGQGMPRQGAPLRNSHFIAQHTDGELVDFIKAGRSATDPKSVMKLPMPPKGTNPGLTDRELEQIVAFIRQMQQESELTASAGL